ncbi:MAG TPA: amino acid adenylation domain-containing protein, partial [Arenimonas sp.]|nr:amino acid adenylation domain-containing protein [Arenimonas sp.]
EIHIGGDGVARGYLNQPALTAERFLRDPFSADPQGRMYRTGDLGRWLPDGNIEYLGRNDFQVKLRGFRIELGEIEARLAACTGVREAVVLAREDVPGDKRLVAYLTTDAGAELQVAELRAQLLGQLPEYMVPSAFVVLDTFPLTPNGKLDRKALPAPDGASLTRREYEAPQGEIEQRLAEIWQSLLKVGEVGRHDHFFELGGHSLLAVQMVSHVRERLGVEVPLRELFARPVLESFAQAVHEAGTSTLGRIERVGRDRPLPLSLAQQRLWFIDQLNAAASRAYHMPAALRLSGQLNRGALKQALDTLVARQEGLRARLVAVDGVPHQVFAPEDAGFALQELDLSFLAPDAREQAIVAQAADEADAPFDLSQGPLIRGRLIREADEEHVLLITQHHIVSDGWSIGVIIREFAALYTAFCEGQANPLPPLEIQYADYAVWQRGWLQGEELERQTTFWREHLVGAPALLELPTDRPRPPMQSHVGGTFPLVLPAELGPQLKQLGQRHGTTLFMVVLAGWSLLLSRLSGQDDVVIGTPVANRQRREVEALVGFFVNTLALRVRVGETASVADLLAQVKDTTLGAFAHQELPFEQVVEAVRPARSMSHSPLFQVMLSLDNTPATDDVQSLPGLTLSSVAAEHLVANFDLSLSLQGDEANLHGELKYAADLFERTTIERFVGQFITLLQAMVADETASPAALPLMTPAQRDQVLSGFNATTAEYPRDALIHALFEAQAAEQPEAIAVVCGGESIRYGELNARANRLAHHLIAQGVQADDRVALCVERSVDTVVGLLGILKAGGAYVPLDPDYPQERLTFLLEDSAPKLLLLQSDLRVRLPASSVPQLVLDDSEALLAAYPDHNPEIRAADSRQLIYMIYTSGSTGTPKGVMVEHCSVANLWSSLEREVFAGLAKTARVGLNASITFDSSVKSLTQLLSGRTLVIFPQAVRQDSAALLAYLREQRVDAFDCTPAQLEMLLGAGLATGAAPEVKTVLIGGEAISTSLWERLRKVDGISFHNVYGPTECTVDATACALHEVATPSIGKPLSNMQVYILDARGAPVPVGVAGEIHIGGDGVARGYWNRPVLTAERFVHDPFRTDPQARMYRTGDLGRWLPDGNVEYLGRNDFQVKLRGFRIELGEIEARLATCAGVREAVVLAREDVPGDKRLVAYVAPTVGAEPTAMQLREALQPQLPEYMVPSAFVVLDAFPLTPNGKLDRKALPAPDGASLALREYEAPQGEAEQELAAIWQSLLKAERVGRHDHFFELGGHSLLAVQVVSHVRERLGVEVPLRELFVHPVLNAFALAVGQAGASTLGRIERVGRDRPLPLSLAQQRLWFIDQLDAAASRAYHMPAALRLSGRLNRDALKAALDRVLVRQEGLRARLVAVDGVPHQVFAPED